MICVKNIYWAFYCTGISAVFHYLTASDVQLTHDPGKGCVLFNASFALFQSSSEGMSLFYILF